MFFRLFWSVYWPNLQSHTKRERRLVVKKCSAVWNTNGSSSSLHSSSSISSLQNWKDLLKLNVERVRNSTTILQLSSHLINDIKQLLLPACDTITLHEHRGRSRLLLPCSPCTNSHLLRVLRHKVQVFSDLDSQLLRLHGRHLHKCIEPRLHDLQRELYKHHSGRWIRGSSADWRQLHKNTGALPGCAPDGCKSVYLWWVTSWTTWRVWSERSCSTLTSRWVLPSWSGP